MSLSVNSWINQDVCESRIFGVPVLITLLTFYDLCGCDPRDVCTHAISNVYPLMASMRLLPENYSPWAFSQGSVSAE